MARSWKTAVAIAAATAAGVVLVAAPASAGALPRNCPSGYLCLYPDSGYRGTPYRVHWRVVKNSCLTVAPSINNRTSSAWNRTGEVQMFYNLSACRRSFLFPMNPGEARDRLGSSINDKVTSVFGRLR
ncbi:peptidase inhibitor family I36 protein [Nonomuraea typhae]|uniref:Peptidase inhibitor family I36 protein n=1 Tax=Nonomuraea typhae TaxID=2603600 RepID=A0ABW7YMY5_9ACTN